MSHNLQIFKIIITFENVIMIFLRFFAISFSFQSAKNHRTEVSIYEELLALTQECFVIETRQFDVTLDAVHLLTERKV